jgi:hypothetical protein
MAGYYDAPKKLLRMLANDVDPAVARSAKQTLE